MKQRALFAASFVVAVVPLVGCSSTLPQRSSPLLEACQRNELARVFQLLEDGADANEIGWSCDSYLEMAFHHHFDSPLSASDVCGTPLAVAAERGHVDIVKALLAHAADVNGNVPALGTPLHLAAHEGQLASVSLLLDHGADPNAVVLPIEDPGVNVGLVGHTPLFLALEAKHYSTAALLLERGADPNVHPHGGVDALSLACSTAPVELVRSLISRGANVNYTRPGGTPLHAAVLRHQEGASRFECVQLLVNLGADVNAKSANGTTPLALAMQHATPPDDTVRLLVSAGAQPIIVNLQPALSAGQYWALAAWHEEKGRLGEARDLYATAAQYYDEAASVSSFVARYTTNKQSKSALAANLASSMEAIGLAAGDGAIAGQMGVAGWRARGRASHLEEQAETYREREAQYTEAAKQCRDGLARCGG